MVRTLIPALRMAARRLITVLTVISICLVGCDSGTDPFAGGGGPTECTTAGSICLDDLLARPEPFEINLIRSQWAQRDTENIARYSYTALDEQTQPDGTRLTVLEGRVDGEVAHYGLVRVPPADVTARPSILLVLQEAGVSVSEFDLLTGARYEEVADQFIQVLVAYRGEALAALGQTYTSTAAPSVYDQDVDDTLGLLRATISRNPAAENDEVAIYGFGRGGTVGLLAALRSPVPSTAYTVRGVVDLAGFTDYQTTSFRAVVTNLLEGRPSSFPGSAFLADEVFDPLREGTLPLSAARSALIRRSPNVFITTFPPTFMRHGTDDNAVNQLQSDRLFQSLLENPLGEVSYETVEGVGHDDLPTLSSVQNAVRSFLLSL